MSEEKFIFHYFKVNARGCIARALLSHVKANWEDHYINLKSGQTNTNQIKIFVNTVNFQSWNTKENSMPKVWPLNYF